MFRKQTCLSYAPYTPFLSLGRLCQRSPRTVPVSLLCVGPTRRRAVARHLQADTHPMPAVDLPSTTAAVGPWDIHVPGASRLGHTTGLPDGGTAPPATCPFPSSVFCGVSASCFCCKRGTGQWPAAGHRCVWRSSAGMPSCRGRADLRYPCAHCLRHNRECLYPPLCVRALKSAGRPKTRVSPFCASA